VVDSERRVGLTILGATGTIGHLALEVAARYPQRIRVLALAAGSNGARLAEQALRHQPTVVALADPQAAEAFAAEVGGRWRGRLLTGGAGILELAAWTEADVVLNGIVGAAGLPPTLAALRAGRRVALANKESLVMAGALVRDALRSGGSELLPVDSEHSAIFQCLAGRETERIERIILTASGGPFREYSAQALAQVSPEQALQHPTWEMGPRITVDSATLFNKGMELIEAHWLFNLPLDRIEVWVHPQSIVHGLLETVEGSVIAQLSCPDMRLPIQLAISHPESWGPAIARCEMNALCGLEFEPPDEARFPCLALARRAGALGGTAPAVANGADEVLVAGFLAGRIPFPAIGEGLRTVLENHAPLAEPTLEQIMEADAWARRAAEQFLAGRRVGSAGGDG
jgi:1-deoxy-D-xylulose-5-phosphate reductoisomerase